MDGILEDLSMGHWVLLEALLEVQKEALVGVLEVFLLEATWEALEEVLVEVVLVTVLEMDNMVDPLVIHPVNPLVNLLVDPLVVL